LKRGFGSGWDIVIPSNWGMAFWMSLVYAGCRPIGTQLCCICINISKGLREYYAMQTEQGQSIFPDDFPDTLSYKLLSSDRKGDLYEVFNRKPPAKRPNYAKLHVSNPFDSPWEQLLRIKDKKAQEQDTTTLPANIPMYFVLRGEQNLPVYIPPSVQQTKRDPSLQWVPKGTMNQEKPHFDPRYTRCSCGTDIEIDLTYHRYLECPW
jgi:hypothetical protein